MTELVAILLGHVQVGGFAETCNRASTSTVK